MCGQTVLGYWRALDEGLGRYWACDADSSLILPALYRTAAGWLHYLEPTFLVFRPDQLCRVFSVCPGQADQDRELWQLLRDSGLREAATGTPHLTACSTLYFTVQI